MNKFPPRPRLKLKTTMFNGTQKQITDNVGQHIEQNENQGHYLDLLSRFWILSTLETVIFAVSIILYFQLLEEPLS